MACTRVKTNALYSTAMTKMTRYFRAEMVADVMVDAVGCEYGLACWRYAVLARAFMVGVKGGNEEWK